MFRSKFLLISSLILALAASSSVWAQQYARPDGTASAGTWTTLSGTLEDAVNEDPGGPEPVDADYIDSGDTGNSTVILSLSDVTDPGGLNQNDHILRFRCRSSGGGQGPESCTVALYEGFGAGATEIDTLNNNSASRGSFALTERIIGDASGIADYTNLYIHLTASGLASGESIQISWAELEVPASSTTEPAVTTDAATGVTQVEATLGGTVTDNGGASIDFVGIFWDTDSDPQTGGTEEIITVPTPETDPFSTTVTGLTAGTPYWFQAYAENSAGRTFGTVEPFTTHDVPTVGTRPVENITATTADLGGDVTDDGGANVTEYGIYWDTAGSPSSGGTQVQFWTGAGPFTGPFIDTVGDDEAALPTDVLVYFQAYATNIYGTAFSTIQSFTPTAPSGPVQASNITFPNASGKSMRISWTRGDGDGSIVIMREDPPDTRVDPVDGVDYAANSDYSNPPPEIGTSNNFVVYKGPDDNAWITGLNLSTTYSVAIHEYTGTGASTDYLEPDPALGSKSTTNVPVHNEDNKVNCVDCHSHGSFFTRDEELKVVCETCHRSSGPASAKLNFDNHLNPSKNPDIDFVDCGMCHELHNPGSVNTTESFNNVTGLPDINKSFLRANVDKYVATASPPAYLHTDTYDAADPESAITPDRAVEGGTEATGSFLATEARGYCQVCHSMTDYHRSTNTAGSNQEHDGAGNNSGLGTEVNCGRCHEHTSGFSWPVDCTKCHNSPKGTAPIRPDIVAMFDRTSKHIPGGSGVVTMEDCLVCHDQTGHPGDKIVGLLSADDGTIFNQPGAGLPTTLTGQGEVFAGNCLSCHDDGQASNLDPDDLSGTPTAGQTYTSPFTNSGRPADITPTADSWNDAAHNRPIATSGSSPVTCVGDGTNGCHGSGHGSDQNSLLAPATGATVAAIDFCFTCHDGSPAANNIFAQFNTGTNYQSTTEGGALINQRHDITSADQTYSGSSVTCANCHLVHVNNDSNPVLDPDTALPLAFYSSTGNYTEDGWSFDYNSGGDADPTNPLGGSGPVPELDYIQFCLTCHDGTLPDGPTMSADNPVVNIADAYAGDQHGLGTGSTGSTINKGNLKPPWNTQAAYEAGNDPSNNYAALNCTICHSPHGTGNIHNLREEIWVAGRQMSTGCPGGATPEPEDDDPWCASSQFAAKEGTSYTLPVNGGSQNDHEYGAWCTFCHNMSAHRGVSETTTCTSAHKHGANSF